MGNSKRQSHQHQVVKQQTIIAESHHSGPLPAPETLGLYDQITPGAAERIISMAEEEAKSRRHNERTTIKHTLIIAYLGIIFAFISVIIVSSLVYYAIYKSYEQTAAAIAVGCIAAVAGVFMFFRRSKKGET